MSKTIYVVYLCLDLLSFIAYVRWVILLVMDDGEEGDARVPNNFLIGLDELPSWQDGGLPHFLPLGASSLPLEPRLSLLPLVGLWGPYRPTNL